ncbi:MAG: tetratricopeptide repeat protein [Kiritimatiellia bacterium]
MRISSSLTFAAWTAILLLLSTPASGENRPASSTNSPAAQGTQPAQKCASEDVELRYGRLLDQARELMAVNQFAKAREVLESAIKEFPEDPAFLTLLGWLCEMENHPVEALNYHRKSLSVAPDSPWSLTSSNRTFRCRLLTREPAKQVLDDWRRATHSVPPDKQGQWVDQAIDAMLIHIAPLPPEHQAEVSRFLLEECSANLPRYGWGLKFLRVIRVQALKEMEQTDALLAFIREEQKRAPFDTMLAKAAVTQQDDYQAYRRELLQAVEKNPEDYASWTELLQLDLDGESPDAKDLPHFEKLVDLCRRKRVEPPIDIFRLHQMMLSQTGADAQQFEQAVRSWREVLPHHPQVLNDLAYLYAERGERLDEALELVNKALRVAPLEANILDTKGWILYRLERPTDAAHYLLLALEIDSEREEIIDHIAEVFAALKLYPSPQAVWNKLFSLNPKHETIARHQQEAGQEE